MEREIDSLILVLAQRQGDNSSGDTNDNTIVVHETENVDKPDLDSVILLNSSKRDIKADRRRQNKLERVNKRQEPMGPIGAGLMMIGLVIALIGSSSDNLGLSVAGLVGLNLAGVLALMSLNRIKKNNTRWKGKGFALFALGLIAALILAFSISTIIKEIATVT